MHLRTQRKLHVAFRLAYLHLTLVHSKGQGHAHFDLNISKMVTDGENITIVINYEVAYRISFNTDLILAYSKGHHDRRKGVTPNILALLFITF